MSMTSKERPSYDTSVHALKYALATLIQGVADPKVLAAVIRGAVAPTLQAEELRTIDVPVFILNGKADAANQKIAGLLKEIPTASFAACEGDHHSTPYQPTFQKAVVQFFEGQWRLRSATLGSKFD